MEYHQFLIFDPEGPVTDEELDVSADGVTALSEGRVEIHTGIRSGDVQVTVAAYSSTPEADPGPWQEVTELSIHSPSGEVLVGALMDDLEDELPSLAVGGSDHHRLRIHARGRDTAIDLTPDEITEHYLIQCWPAPPAPPRSLSSRDQYGAQLRSGPPAPTEAPVANRGPRGQSARERDILHRSLESDG
ncbi:hypothetical protein STRAU_0909 [Streptomyces aurantiacus JA 4570]|uniref:Uncharacterized protein n=1 Tax=Streptomyces aurantiacus JA 4570 TaxID=1286094 RepID=S3ZS88_9ACTN|nr:hypothetical protein [Streptomyces aurantiacus]EPH46028.1 hypothetical protein STRAU_0909 [Streptomyces aurantiacus JA 4570]